jgi:hypothetical protein
MRKAKTMSAEIQTVGIDEMVMGNYTAWGYNADEAIVLEKARAEILTEQRNGILSIVKAGNVLNATKDAIPHGEWGKYLKERLAMSQDTSERLMASARLVASNPKILDLADRMRPTALYALARGKASNDDVIAAVIDAYGDSGEITQDAVKDTAELVLPKGEAKEKKAPFKPIDAVLAADELDRLDALLAQIVSRGSSVGIVYDKVLKNTDFRNWLKSEGGKVAASVAAYVYLLQTSSGVVEIIDSE